MERIELEKIIQEGNINESSLIRVISSRKDARNGKGRTKVRYGVYHFRQENKLPYIVHDISLGYLGSSNFEINKRIYCSKVLLDEDIVSIDKVGEINLEDLSSFSEVESNKLNGRVPVVMHLNKRWKRSLPVRFHYFERKVFVGIYENGDICPGVRSYDDKEYLIKPSGLLINSGSTICKLQRIEC